LGLNPPLSLIFYKNFLYGECIGLDFYKNKGSVCRWICLLSGLNKMWISREVC